MCFCETNPNSTGAISDVTTYSYGIYEAELKILIRVRFSVIDGSPRRAESRHSKEGGRSERRR
jgi:hypothetical protein